MGASLACAEAREAPPAKPRGHAPPAKAGGGVALHQIGRFDEPIDVVAAPGVRRRSTSSSGPAAWWSCGGITAGRFLDIASRTTTGGERGLLSIAFSPRFQRDHLVYAYYTNNAGNIEVDSFRASARGAQP